MPIQLPPFVYLTGNVSAPKWSRNIARDQPLGMLLSPEGWRYPHCRHYVLDNDVYPHSFLGSRFDEGWWEREGEKKWLKMLDKVPTDHPPMWVLLPDVVADWHQTIDRAWRYRIEVESRGFKCALALQDGCNWKEANDFGADAFFVAGTTYWKWVNAPQIVAMFKNKVALHLGRVNGERPIRLARKLGFDSADGSGLARFFNDQLPRVLRGFEESPQLELWD